MYKHQSISSIVEITLSKNDKCYEPVKRVKDLSHVSKGFRDKIVEPHFVKHTYPISGGVSIIEIMLENLTKNNSIMKKIIEGNIYHGR